MKYNAQNLKPLLKSAIRNLTYIVDQIHKVENKIVSAVDLMSVVQLLQTLSHVRLLKDSQYGVISIVVKIRQD